VPASPPAILFGNRLPFLAKSGEMVSAAVEFGRVLETPGGFAPHLDGPHLDDLPATAGADG
jgi:hypothetical protein